MKRRHAGRLRKLTDTDRDKRDARNQRRKRAEQIFARKKVIPSDRKKRDSTTGD